MKMHKLFFISFLWNVRKKRQLVWFVKNFWSVYIVGGIVELDRVYIR